MTSPFKSTLGVAARRRQRPVVERSTFVIVQVGGAPVAFPVEQVERVLRAVRWSDTVMHEGESVRVRQLATILTTGAGDVSHGEHRVLVLRAQRDTAARFAVAAHDVREVFAVETALVAPVTRTHAASEALPPLTHPAVRGRFDWRGETVWVLDAARLGEP